MAALAGARIGRDRGGIVEIEQHGRMPGRRQQHVAEAAEGMGADRLAFIGAGHGSDDLLAPGHGEMVGPELHPALDEGGVRSEEHTSELQSLMRISYAVFCLKKKTR